MKALQNLCASLGLLAVLLVARSASSQLATQTSMNLAIPSPETSILAQATPTKAEMTTINDLMERVQVGYSQKGNLHPETPIEWNLGENLMVAAPTGWGVGFQAHQGKLAIIEFVPADQTLEHWKDLLTIQTILGGLSETPSQLSEDFVSLFKRVCPNLDVSSVVTGEENAYPFALWIQNCPNNPQVNQAEITLFKLIKGNDRFYFVHRAWRVPSLSPQQAIPINPTSLEEWGRYMRLVKVCDTQIPEKNCP